jgi:hypothetical protein
MKPDDVWLSTSGKVHRRQTHCIEQQLIGRRDGLSVQGDLYVAIGPLGSWCRVLTASGTKAPKYATISVPFSRPHVTIHRTDLVQCPLQRVAFSSPTPVVLVSGSGC